VSESGGHAGKFSIENKSVPFSTLFHAPFPTRDGKGQKDPVVPLPKRLEQPLREHLEKVRALPRQDLAQGYGEVFLPDVLARKWPKAPSEWIWQLDSIYPKRNLKVPQVNTAQAHREDGFRSSRRLDQQGPSEPAGAAPSVLRATVPVKGGSVKARSRAPRASSPRRR
jgi:hypothetical protein